MCTIGSLDGNSGRAVSPGRTHLFPDYEATCNGTVYSWQFCVNSVATMMGATLYPSVWRPQSPGLYMLVRANEITITSEEECQGHNVSSDQQFSVEAGDIVGVYTNNVTLIQFVNMSTTSFSYNNNQSGTVDRNIGARGDDYNIAIKVILSKFA